MQLPAQKPVRLQQFDSQCLQLIGSDRPPDKDPLKPLQTNQERETHRERLRNCRVVFLFHLQDHLSVHTLTLTDVSNPDNHRMYPPRGLMAKSEERESSGGGVAVHADEPVLMRYQPPLALASGRILRRLKKRFLTFSLILKHKLQFVNLHQGLTLVSAAL
ncbi:Hypothetical predicted protein [Xyrichtys novacula]|uniref:Uncharacterized protein n=1 Tax=Xyrichtys novacula TaxID=13765 RepID=A0AAV1FE27_XYRNO|nr:Hypothetical predicted protein [Xyrichtys novacula]